MNSSPENTSTVIARAGTLISTTHILCIKRMPIIRCMDTAHIITYKDSMYVNAPAIINILRPKESLIAAINN